MLLFTCLISLFGFCRRCIENALCSAQANCPLCNIPAWLKDVQSDRQMAMLIKQVASLDDLTTPSVIPEKKKEGKPMLQYNTQLFVSLHHGIISLMINLFIFMYTVQIVNILGL